MASTNSGGLERKPTASQLARQARQERRRAERLGQSDTHGSAMDMEVPVVTDEARAAMRTFPEERTTRDLDAVWTWLKSTSSVARFFSLVSLAAEARHDLCRSLKLLAVQRGALVYRQGDSGSSFFVILTGAVEMRHCAISGGDRASKRGGRFGEAGALVDAEDRSHLGRRVGNVPAGECFGELSAAKRGWRRGATAVSLGSMNAVTGEIDRALVLQVDAAAFRYCKKRMFQKVEASVARRVVLFKRLHLLNDWPDEELSFLAQWCRDVRAPARSEVYRAGGKVDGVYFLTSGEVGLTMPVRVGSDGEARRASVDSAAFGGASAADADAGDGEGTLRYINVEYVPAPFFFGELDVVNRLDRRSCSASTLTPIVATFCPAPVFRTLVVDEYSYRSSHKLLSISRDRREWRTLRLEDAGLTGNMPFPLMVQVQSRFLSHALTGKKNWGDGVVEGDQEDEAAEGRPALLETSDAEQPAKSAAHGNDADRDPALRLLSRFNSRNIGYSARVRKIVEAGMASMGGIGAATAEYSSARALDATHAAGGAGDARALEPPESDTTNLAKVGAPPSIAVSTSRPLKMRRASSFVKRSGSLRGADLLALGTAAPDGSGKQTPGSSRNGGDGSVGRHPAVADLASERRRRLSAAGLGMMGEALGGGSGPSTSRTDSTRSIDIFAAAAEQTDAAKDGKRAEVPSPERERASEAMGDLRVVMKAVWQFKRLLARKRRREADEAHARQQAEEAQRDAARAAARARELDRARARGDLETGGSKASTITQEDASAMRGTLERRSIGNGDRRDTRGRLYSRRTMSMRTSQREMSSKGTARSLGSRYSTHGASSRSHAVSVDDVVDVTVVEHSDSDDEAHTTGDQVRDANVLRSSGPHATANREIAIRTSGSMRTPHAPSRNGAYKMSRTMSSRPARASNQNPVGLGSIRGVPGRLPPGRPVPVRARPSPIHRDRIETRGSMTPTGLNRIVEGDEHARGRTSTRPSRAREGDASRRRGGQQHRDRADSSVATLPTLRSSRTAVQRADAAGSAYSGIGGGALHPAPLTSDRSHLPLEPGAVRRTPSGGEIVRLAARASFRRRSSASAAAIAEAAASASSVVHPGASAAAGVAVDAGSLTGFPVVDSHSPRGGSPKHRAALIDEVMPADMSPPSAVDGLGSARLNSANSISSLDGFVDREAPAPFGRQGSRNMMLSHLI